MRDGEDRKLVNTNVRGMRRKRVMGKQEGGRKIDVERELCVE